MIYVSLLIEILRSRPRLIFWLVTLTQALLWAAVPALFYFSPPGEVPGVLALGNDFRLGADVGPPLAYWLAELAFLATGRHLVGVYLISQVCVAVTYWAVFALGRATLGDRHAVLAILLMTGISAFTVPTPDFGPAILAMPLWALALLHLWRALGEGRRLYWYALALDLGLLLLTSYFALVLIGLVAIFMLGSEHGRARLSSMEPWIASAIVLVPMLAHLFWLDQASAPYLPGLGRLRSAEAVDRNLIAWLRLAGLIVVAHAGAGILIAIASNLTRVRRAEAAAIERAEVDPAARSFINFFAIAPVLGVTLIAVIIGISAAPALGPLLVLSGLAFVLAAGERILLHHQRIIGAAFLALLLLPPALTAAAVSVLPPILGLDLKVAQPAAAMNRFFSESFERRTGKRLTIVAGDPRLAHVVALGPASQPRVFPGEPPGGPLARKDIGERGAIVLWPATDSAGNPPADVKALFPDLVPEVPQTFARPIQGRLPLLRIGWALIRPQAAP